MERSAQAAEARTLICDHDDAVFCPSLALSSEIVCDRCGILHAPTRTHLWEYCMTDRYRRCPLMITAARL